MRLRSCQRVRRQRDFDQFRSVGVFKNAAGFFVKIKKNLQNVLPRLAVIVGRKIGDAHERNYIKRVFRGIFRQEQSRLDPQSDYLIVVRKGVDAKFYILKEKFLKMCATDPNRFITLAIDGTAASGKSSTAWILAQRYRLLNVNTGEHYRTLTYFLMQKGATDASDDRIVEILSQFKFGTQVDGISAHLSIDGVVPRREELRSEMVNKHVAFFAHITELREMLKQYERSLISLAQEMSFAGIVMEGRDICSVVIPDAGIKIFLTADLDVRTLRREKEKQKDSVAQRDAVDQCHYPQGATLIDSSKYSLEQVVEIVEGMMRNGRA